jgi:hypothetical protein
LEKASAHVAQSRSSSSVIRVSDRSRYTLAAAVRSVDTAVPGLFARRLAILFTPIPLFATQQTRPHK